MKAIAGLAETRAQQEKLVKPAFVPRRQSALQMLIVLRIMKLVLVMANMLLRITIIVAWMVLVNSVKVPVDHAICIIHVAEGYIMIMTAVHMQTA